MGSNIAGYLPLGFLLGLGMVRSGWPRGAVLLLTVVVILVVVKPF